MRRAIILSTLLMTLVQSYGQTDTIRKDEPIVNESSMEIPEEEAEVEETFEFFAVEQPAKFPGGEAELTRYIAKNFKIPEIAREANAEGMVLIQFVIDTTGHPVNVMAEPRKPKLGFGLEEEGVRVVKSMPKWTPASSRGTKVRMRYRVPIRIRFE